MYYPTVSEILSGSCAWCPFRHIGVSYVTGQKITDQAVAQLHQRMMSAGARKLAVDHALSVLVASKAINKAMGKDIHHGMYGD